MPVRPNALSFECIHHNCDAFPYATAEEAAACRHTSPGEHAAARPVPTESGRFVTVDNGFGGSTTRTASPAGRVVSSGSAPTEKQTAYLRSLLERHAGLEPAEVVRATLNARRSLGTLDRAVVSKAIDDLLAIKVVRAGSARPRATEAEGRVTIDAGALPTPARGVLRFAVPNESGSLTFLALKFRSGDDIIVCQEIGGSGDTYLGRQNAGTSYRGKFGGLVAKVLADPTEAMLTYGREIGRCGHCGTTLTNEASRAAGIGPVCARKG